MNKYRTFLSLAVTVIIGLAGLLVWAEREDRMQGGRTPNSQARYTLEGIWRDESVYLSEHNDFARSLSKLKVSNRIDSHTIEFIPSESNSRTVVYHAVPDRFNWMMFDLNMYTIAIVKSNSTNIGTKPLTCASPLGSNIVPKIEVSIPSIKNSRPALKCSPGSYEIGDP